MNKTNCNKQSVVWGFIALMVAIPLIGHGPAKTEVLFGEYSQPYEAPVGSFSDTVVTTPVLASPAVY